MTLPVENGLRWSRRNDPDEVRRNKETALRIEEMIRASNTSATLSAIDHWPPSDILELMLHLRSRYARQLLEWLPEELGLGVLTELDPRFSALMARGSTVAKIAKMLCKMERSRVLDVLDGLPDHIVSALLEGHPHGPELHEALKREEDSADAAMRHGLLTVAETETVSAVIDAIRARVDQIDRLERVFVVDAGRRLKGYLRLRDLLLSSPDERVSEIMRPDPLAVTATTDQAEVLAIAEATGRSDLAVVDNSGRLIGSITAKELAEIAREESEEDMLLMGGVSPKTTEFDSPLQIVQRRFPWLLGGLVGASVAAIVIGSYEEELSEAAILASFIPVVMATAGNAGIQASTVSIQAISQTTTWSGEVLPRIVRELLGATMNGLLVGLVVAFLVVLAGGVIGLERTADLALTALASLTTVTAIAGTFGACVPYILNARGIDPAVATGIFITTTNDVVGVLVFFAIASVLFL